MLDVQKFVEGIHDYIGRALSPFAERIRALEDRAPIAGDPGKDGADGHDGKDGLDGKDAPAITAEQLVDAIKAMPDVLEGIVKAWLAENPPASGKDGADGRDGKDAEQVSEEQIAKSVASHIALNPPAAGRDGRDGQPGIKGLDGKDGKDGANGLDGLSVKDFDAVLANDGRTLTLSLGDGERRIERSLSLPVTIDRGVFKEGNAYAKGDGVTWAGSFWIAQKDAPEGKPEGGDGWRLAVKRGRDGRDGVPAK